MRLYVAAILRQLNEEIHTFTSSILILGGSFAVDMLLLGQLMESSFIFSQLCFLEKNVAFRHIDVQL